MTPLLTLLSHEVDVTSLQIRSTLLGDLDVNADNVFTFPRGLLGFPECRQFALMRGAREGLFWLQSMEYSTLAFLLIDPFAVEADYSFDVSPAQLVEIGQGEPADIGLLAVVTLPANRGELPTVNLQGPLVINFKTRRAKQIVSQEADFSVRRPVDLGRVVA